MRLDIDLEQVLPASVQRVWQALTDPDMLAMWLMASDDFEARVGARFSLRDVPAPGDGCRVACEVLELSPPHRMVWSWVSDRDGARTRLVIELEPQGQTTLLKLRHTGDTDEQTITRTTGGWHEKLGQLAAVLTRQES